jgi:glycosyltransferase involved in cell wall biosynthesis
VKPPQVVTVVTPGFRPQTGGVETHTFELVTELTRQGIDVEVLTARRDITRRKVEVFEGYRVITYPAWPIRSMSVSPQLLSAAVRRRKDSGTVLVHVHSYHATTAMAVLGARVPTVFTPHYHGKHGHSALADVLHLGFDHLGRILFQRADAVICVSKAERDELVRDFPAVGERVTVIPNGVRSGSIRAAVPYPDQPPTVLCVGRLEPYKDVAQVIRAFADIAPPAQLVIIGDGSQRDELVTLAGGLGASDRIRLLGPVSDAILHRWLRTATVYISMSKHEAFGMTPLEAASAGARIILSDIPAHREIATDYLGGCVALVSNRTPAAITAEIIRQLTHGSSARARIPDWADVTARTIDIYSSVSRGAVGTAPVPQLPNKHEGES